MTPDIVLPCRAVSPIGLMKGEMMLSFLSHPILQAGTSTAAAARKPLTLVFMAALYAIVIAHAPAAFGAGSGSALSTMASGAVLGQAQASTYSVQEIAAFATDARRSTTRSVTPSR